MIQRTRRIPGKISSEEVSSFQRKYGLEVDGVAGDQTWGQVILVCEAYKELSGKHDRLIKRYAEVLSADKAEGSSGCAECNVCAGLFWGAVGTIFLWASGILDWLGSFF